MPHGPAHLTLGIAGLVLAGGRSIRFGSEKAAALLNDRPLLIWTLDRLSASCAPLAVSARPGSQAESMAAERGLAVLHDNDGDAAGPLAGVRAGLEWARRRGARLLAVQPCDAPHLPRDLVERLAAAIGDGSAAVAETADGLQPLCTLWRVEASTWVQAALAGGAHPAVWRLLDDIGAVRVRFEDGGAFANINTPDDLR